MLENYKCYVTKSTHYYVACNEKKKKDAHSNTSTWEDGRRVGYHADGETHSRLFTTKIIILPRYNQMLEIQCIEMHVLLVTILVKNVICTMWYNIYICVHIFISYQNKRAEFYLNFCAKIHIYFTSVIWRHISCITSQKQFATEDKYR